MAHLLMTSKTDLFVRWRSEERRVGIECRVGLGMDHSSRRRHTRSKRDWSSDVCSSDLAVYPLWTEQENALALLQEFVELNFKARIIKIDHEKLPKSWIGRLIDGAFIDDIKNRSVCPM